MSTKTQHTFEVGDYVEVTEGFYEGVRGHIMSVEPLGFPVMLMQDDEGEWFDERPGWLEPIICDYCDSRKGCTCQEDIDAAESEHFSRQMAAAERDYWTEDKDRRAEEEEEGL